MWKLLHEIDFRSFTSLANHKSFTHDGVNSQLSGLIWGRMFV